MHAVRIVLKDKDPATSGPEVEPIVTWDQLARAWGCSRWTIMRRVLDGTLPPLDALPVKNRGWWLSTLKAKGIRFMPEAS